MNAIESAERALLCAVFRAYPEACVWIGGSVLRLVHGSPRTSYDLDLAPRGELPPSAQVVNTLHRALEEWNAATGNEFLLDEGARAEHSTFLRLIVNEKGTFRFTVDFTKIAGRVVETTAIVLESALGPQAVVIPTDAGLLALKTEALLFRRFLKPADVFDIWFLLAKGVRLSRAARVRLSDRLAMAEVTPAEAESRLRRLGPEKFLSDLRRRISAGPVALWDERKAKSAIDRVAAFLRKELRP